MQIEAKPVGNLSAGRTESDISEVTLGRSGLRVLVEALLVDGHERYAVELHFDAPRGFRYLDEGDLLRYWRSKVFSPCAHLFEITSGGWLDQERQCEGMLNTTDAVGTCREWFICTSNGCMNVLSVNEPLVREFHDL